MVAWTVTSSKYSFRCAKQSLAVSHDDYLAAKIANSAV
jgi:hypothetical protein